MEDERAAGCSSPATPRPALWFRHVFSMGEDVDARRKAGHDEPQKKAGSSIRPFVLRIIL
jgi:hypothetical protein